MLLLELTLHGLQHLEWQNRQDMAFDDAIECDPS